MKYKIDPSILADIEAAKKALSNMPSKEVIAAALGSMPKIDPQSLNFSQVDLSAFKEMQKNALAVFPEWQKQLTAQLQPLANLEKHFEPFLASAQTIGEQFARI